MAMPKFNWREWLRSFNGRRAAAGPRGGRKSRLSMEQLETRLSPATAIWTGTTGNNFWSDPGNWNRVGGGVIQPGDDLVFDNTGATHLSTVNDEPTGFVVNSITISNTSGGYQLKPKVNALTNSIVLGSATSTGNLIVNTSGGDSISFNVAFGGTSGNEQFQTILASTALTVSGQLSGASGVTLTKTGVGRLILTNDNTT